MNLRIFAISLMLTACSFGPNAVEAPSDPAALNVLFIGNSLTTSNDLPGIVHALIDSAGAGPAEVATVAFNNYGLQDHWVSGERYEDRDVRRDCGDAPGSGLRSQSLVCAEYSRGPLNVRLPLHARI
jgi:hypothetical protein